MTAYWGLSRKIMKDMRGWSKDKWFEDREHIINSMEISWDEIDKLLRENKELKEKIESLENPVYYTMAYPTRKCVSCGEDIRLYDYCPLCGAKQE